MSTKIDYAKRDNAVLLHTAKYRVTMKKVISETHTDGKECGHVITRLAKQGLVEIHSKAAAGRYTFLSITPKGASKAGFRPERGQLTGKSLDDRLGLTFACFLDSTHRRVLLSNPEANRLLDTTDSIPRSVDVIAAEEPHVCGLFRVYRPDSLKSATNGLAALYQSLQSDPAIQKAMTAGVFGVAVLARDQKLWQQLKSLLDSSRNPLGEDCHHLLALGPGVDTLGACLKQRKMKR